MDGVASFRLITDGDPDAIAAVHRAAFGPVEGEEIVALERALRHDATARPLLSILAVEDGRAVGHVLFTAVALEPEAPGVSARILAPLGVLAAHRRQGIGGGLVQAGLSRLRRAGVAMVFVLGDPDYYGRFGFRPALPLGLEPPRPIPSGQGSAWQVTALQASVPGALRGRVRCATALDQPQYW